MPSKHTHQDLVNSLARRLEKTHMVNAETQCWEWTGCKSQGGYGVIGTRIEGRTSTFVHRASWIVKNGAIPKDKVICHRCDNPSCFNPDHLWIGTPVENMQDMLEKGRNSHSLMYSQYIIEVGVNKSIFQVIGLFDENKLSNEEIQLVLESLKQHYKYSI